MRGKALYRVRAPETNGITPAYAGKSYSKPYGIYRGGDHPRLCGEKPDYQHLQIEVSGSPPPMRGKERFIASAPSVNRITPAYAGKRIWEARA